MEECPGGLWPGIQLRKCRGFRIAGYDKALCHSVTEGELFYHSWGDRGQEEGKGKCNYDILSSGHRIQTCLTDHIQENAWVYIRCQNRVKAADLCISL